MLDKRTVYKLLKSNLHITNMEGKINDLAEEGWKYVGSSIASHGPYLIFSRLEEKPESSKLGEILKHVQKDSYV